MIRTDTGPAPVGSDRSPERGRPLVVLFSFPRPHAATNPYIVQLTRAVAADTGLRAEFFTWRQALLGRYDVFHTHWPELMFSGPPGPKTLAKQVMMLTLLVRLRLSGTPIVRTLHNVTPHERKTRIERTLIRLVNRRTAGWIRLNPTTAAPSARPCVTVLHGHYVDWFASYDIPASTSGAVVFAGQVRRYKNIPGLLSAFGALVDDGLSLRIVGKPTDDRLATELTTQAGHDSRVEFVFGHLSDADLAREVGRAELVVLPYSEMHNSGAALLALSLGRPVLVPANEVTGHLAAEVGPGWVQRYSGVLTGQHIVEGLAAVRSIPAGSLPDLSARGWDSAAAAHSALYHRVLPTRRARKVLP